MLSAQALPQLALLPTMPLVGLKLHSAFWWIYMATDSMMYPRPWQAFSKSFELSERPRIRIKVCMPCMQEAHQIQDYNLKAIHAYQCSHAETPGAMSATSSSLSPSLKLATNVLLLGLAVACTLFPVLSLRGGLC